MTKRITTVLGDIAPEELGFTSLHDHTFLDLTTAAEYMTSIFFDTDPSQLTFIPENYSYLKTGTFLLCEALRKIEDVQELTAEYAYFQKLGGCAVVDPAPANIRPEGYAEKSRNCPERQGCISLRLRVFIMMPPFRSGLRGMTWPFITISCARS